MGGPWAINQWLANIASLNWIGIKRERKDKGIKKREEKKRKEADRWKQMIAGSQEWSKVQPIDWRQITSLSLPLSLSSLLCLSLSRACSLSVSNSFDVMETLQKGGYLPEPLAVHKAFSTQMPAHLVFWKGGQASEYAFLSTAFLPM